MEERRRKFSLMTFGTSSEDDERILGRANAEAMANATMTMTTMMMMITTAVFVMSSLIFCLNGGGLNILHSAALLTSPRASSHHSTPIMLSSPSHHHHSPLTLRPNIMSMLITILTKSPPYRYLQCRQRHEPLSFVIKNRIVNTHNREDENHCFSRSLPQSHNGEVSDHLRSSRPRRRRPSPSFLSRLDAARRPSGDEEEGMKIEASQLKKGDTVMKENIPYRIQSIFSVNVARGAAFYRSKVLNYNTNTIQEMNFRTGDKLRMAEVRDFKAIYSYMDDSTDNLVFQNMQTWDEINVNPKVCQDDFDLLQIGMECRVRVYRNVGVEVTLPASSVYTVKELSGGGTGAVTRKIATLETGAAVLVPDYIQIGDQIQVNTKHRQYSQRV